MSYKVYLLKSELDNTYYIGYTGDIENRLEYHNNGKVKYTSKKKPWRLMGYEEYNKENEARWREYTLKHNANEHYKFIKKVAKIYIYALLAQLVASGPTGRRPGGSSRHDNDMSYKVYLLKSELDNTYYIGYTGDIENRLEYHNNGKVKYTSKKKPWRLIGYEEYNKENEARWREYTLKHNANEHYKFIKKVAKI